MTNEEARRLALRIIDTWPGHVIKAYVWTEALTDLDHTTALGVYEYLRDRDERAPNIARFLAIYNNVNPSYGWPVPANTGEVITPHTGRQIARLAYAEECARQGRAPNWGWVDKILGNIGE